MTERIASFVTEAAADIIRQAADEIGTPTAALINRDANSLLQAPEMLAARLRSAMEEVPTIGALEWLAENALDLPGVTQTTAQRRIQASNQDALVHLVRDLAALELAARLPKRQFASRDDLRAGYRKVDDLLQFVHEDADDDVHRNVAALRREIIEHVRQAAAGLPELTVASPAAVLPALVVAWDLYEDLDRATEIASRNALVRPGFVPARPIAVLQ